MVAKFGDRVRIQFSRLSSADGESGKASAPKVLEFTIGGDHVLPGLSRHVTGMRQGEQKTLTLQPEEAYGPVQARLIREVPRDSIRTKSPLKLGMQLNARTGGASPRRMVRVVELKSDSVVIDANHPRAGRVVNLLVFLVSVDSSPEANSSQPQFDNGGEA